jgi:2-keto-3-deoxy-L-fuconate dehydrogenase
MTRTLNGKRILVTQADEFMGPMLCEVLAEHGADVVRDTAPLVEPGAADAVVLEAGAIDILVVNLAYVAPSGLRSLQPWSIPCRVFSGRSCRR